ncbi:MAG: DUF1194 domain-containing protein, partial [Phycisphaerales bacterium JB038]
GSGSSTTLGSSAGGSDDIFIAYLNAYTGELKDFLIVGDAQDEAGKDINMAFAYDNSSGYVLPVAYTTGSFAGQVDFAPAQSNFGDETSSGGDDVFVARYDSLLNLDWVWTSGSVGQSQDDVGEGIVVSGTTLQHAVFVCGGVGAAAPPAADDDDIWLARLNAPATGSPTVAWDYALESSVPSDPRARASDLSLDAAGMLVVTGFFAQKVDFDPDSAATDEREATGSYDIFLARYYPTGDYDGAETFGGPVGVTVADVGVAVDCIVGTTADMTGVWLHAGYFGGGGGSGYTIDFDPDPGNSANAVSAGAHDGFLNAFTFDPPVVGTAIMLVLDASGSMASEYQCSPGYFYWDAMIDAYQDIILDPNGVIPRDGTVALAVTIFAETEEDARQVVPWRVIDSADAAEGFSLALDSIVPPGGLSFLSSGMEVARESLENGHVVADYNIINITSNGLRQEDLSNIASEKNLALDEDDGVVDMINGVAIESEDPDLNLDFLAYVIGNNVGRIEAERMGCVAVAEGTYAICPPAEGDSDFKIEQIKKFIYERYGHCDGDANQDCELGQSDLGVILANWGKTSSDPDFPDDLDWNDDEVIGQYELGVVLANYECTND